MISSSYHLFLVINYFLGNSLAVQWSGLCPFTAKKANIQSLVWKLRFCKLQGEAKKKKREIHVGNCLISAVEWQLELNDSAWVFWQCLFYPSLSNSVIHWVSFIQYNLLFAISRKLTRVYSGTCSLNLEKNHQCNSYYLAEGPDLCNSASFNKICTVERKIDLFLFFHYRLDM